MNLQLPPEHYQMLEQRNYRAALEEAQQPIKQFLFERGLPGGNTPEQTAKILTDNFNQEGNESIARELLSIGSALLGGLLGGGGGEMSEAERRRIEAEREAQRQKEFLKIAALAVAAAVAVYFIAKK